MVSRLPEGDAAFGGIGSSDDGPVEGIVSEEVATVWLVDGRNNARIPARMLSLDYSAALDDAGRRYLDKVRSGAQNMDHLIDGLLSFSRLQRRMRLPQRLARDVRRLPLIGRQLDL